MRRHFEVPIKILLVVPFFSTAAFPIFHVQVFITYKEAEGITVLLTLKLMYGIIRNRILTLNDLKL